MKKIAQNSLMMAANDGWEMVGGARSKAGEVGEVERTIEGL